MMPIWEKNNELLQNYPKPHGHEDSENILEVRGGKSHLSQDSTVDNKNRSSMIRTRNRSQALQHC